MKVRIEGVKGADIKLIEGDFLAGRKQYHSWPYTINKGDVIGVASQMIDDKVTVILILLMIRLIQFGCFSANCRFEYQVQCNPYKTTLQRRKN